MTDQDAAQSLADRLAAAHDALADVTASMKTFTRECAKNNPQMGPLTRKTFVAEAQAVEALLDRLHLNITPFDPRPKPFDGGGK